MHLWPWPARFEVDPTKLDSFLLNLAHEKGRSRAKFFIGVGFAAHALRNALLDHAVLDHFVGITVGNLGLKLVFEGLIATPKGGLRPIRSVWHMTAWGDGTAWFVTAIPLKP